VGKLWYSRGHRLAFPGLQVLSVGAHNVVDLEQEYFAEEFWTVPEPTSKINESSFVLSIFHFLLS